MSASKNTDDRLTEKHNWRIRAQYKAWIGKPDPSGFGKYCVCFTSPQAMRTHVPVLQSRGHRIVAIERWENNRWQHV